ncbi:hypothetical protein HMJ29_00380 [Hymenobacter taeanensis]|uniref:Uncharacterized protein n=1 Tax=Hymenobacter taeanensis TaxID=2735321 RepID=A0A6M6BDZ7_9BACT|nr:MULTISPECIES: hypothetical protein [Hymenobacter]QJX45473.1 hypothetical protein HMJ29_00380 [Hymenobacter taeanensis]UOQ81281.1 hypothetical protein MUN83_00325 [Hymenobacter sp. 5414T-23]
MSELLFDVNLQQLPDEYLTGEWTVADRVLNRTDPASALAQATVFRLQPGLMEIQTPELHNQGSWKVERDGLLNRPYLELDLAAEKTRALVTRLRRSADGLHSQLNLYFQSGMELQLAQPSY